MTKFHFSAVGTLFSDRLLGTSMLFTISSISTNVYAEPGHNDAGGGHMDHMNKVLHRLKHELGDKYDQVVPVVSKEQLVSEKKHLLNFA